MKNLGAKVYRDFSKFSVLLYTEKITTVIPVQTANYSNTVLVLHYNSNDFC